MPGDRTQMSANEWNFPAGSLSETRANAWRHWIWLVTAAIDGLVVMAMVGLVSLVYHLQAYGGTPREHVTLELAAILAAIFVAMNAMRGRYKQENYLSTKGQIAAVFSVWHVTIVAFIAILFLTKIDHFSRAVILASYLTGFPVIALARWVMVRTISVASKTGRITSERVFLIGREPDVMSFVSRHQPWNVGFAIADVAFLRSNDVCPNSDPTAALAADLASAVAKCRINRPDSVFIALPWLDQETIDACVDAFMNLPVAIHLTPEKIIDRFETPHIVRIGSLSSLRLTRRPLSMAEIALKRVFDVVAASLILILSTPLLLAVAALIRLDSPGPVLFRQRRYGFNQQAFRIFKFRTMTTTDDGNVIVQATRHDPRITRIGRVLRRYNLDELPQLLNVVAGQMSLVGPRPHALAHDQAFERRIALYSRRHNVLPGITGWAQVNGLRGETDTDEKMAKRVAFDHWYIDNWSFWLDIAILFRTVLSKKAFVNAC
jgi:Undecaprenyl-phosphate glucose phosphotransferase